MREIKIRERLEWERHQSRHQSKCHLLFFALTGALCINFHMSEQTHPKTHLEMQSSDTNSQKTLFCRVERVLGSQSRSERRHENNRMQLGSKEKE